MERIFEYDEEMYMRKMKEISDEAFEAYSEFLYSNRIPEDKLLCFSLLKIVYLYVKENRSKRDWKTETLVFLLYRIALSGEIFFLSTYNNIDEIILVRDAFRDSSQPVINMAVLAGIVLEYYYRVYEEQYHTAGYSKMIRSNLKQLMSVDETMIDTTKILAKKEVPLPVRIKEYLDLSVQVQEDAKKIVSMAVYRFAEYGENTTIMLEGTTGCGKTLLFDSLASCDFLNKELTFYSYTATQFTPNGFIGDSLDNMLKGFKNACEARGRRAGHAVKNPEKGIIFLDEFDKLFMSNTDSNGEDVNQIVLFQLLTVLAGTADIADVNTKNILFILAGAFENIEDIRESRKKKAKMGFASQQVVLPGVATGKYDLRKELLQMGASRQLVARISHFVHMEPIDRETMKQILVNPRNGLLTKKAETLWRDGLILRIESDEVIECMLDRIMESRAGVRGVKEMIDNLISHYDYDMIEQGYRTMIIHRGVLDGEPPKFEKNEVLDESIVRFD